MQFLDPSSENSMPAEKQAKIQRLDSTVHLKSLLSASQTALYN